jgi:hypothetical protein
VIYLPDTVTNIGDHIASCTVHQVFRNDHGGPPLVLKYSKGGMLLQPQPSDDPHDPLNFPTWQKLSILVILAYWAFLGTANLIIVVSSTLLLYYIDIDYDHQGPSFFQLAQNYRVSFTDLAYTINGPLVAYGIGVGDQLIKSTISLLI